MSHAGATPAVPAISQTVSTGLLMSQRADVLAVPATTDYFGQLSSLLFPLLIGISESEAQGPMATGISCSRPVEAVQWVPGQCKLHDPLS